MKVINGLVLILAIILAGVGSAQAQGTFKWTTGAGDGTGKWSVGANWTNTVAPSNDCPLVFGTTTGTTTLSNDLAISLNVNNTFTFNADAPAYTINGIDYNNFGPGGFVVNSAGGVTQTINFNITAKNNQIPVTGSGNLTLNGTFSKGGTYNPYLDMLGTGVLTIGGSGTLNTAGGTSPLTVDSGTVVLARTYASGGFNVGLTINGGTVKLGAAEQFRSGTSPLINGGTLDLNGYDNALGGNGAVVADGSSSGVNHNGGSTQLTGLGGRVINNAAGTGTNWLVINQNGGQQASYGGTITDGATAKVGVTVVANYNQSAFQAFSGNNTYSGGTFIQHNYTGSGGRPEILSIGNMASIGSAGYRNLTFKGGAADANVVLQLTGTAVTNSDQFNGLTFTSGQGAGFDIADPNNTFTLGKNAGGTDIAFTGAGIFEKLGAGTLVVKSALAYTGGTYLGGGTLKIDAQNGGSLPSGSVMTFAGGNLYYLGKTSGTTTQTLGSIGLAALNNYGANSGGAGMITVDANGGGGTTVNFNGLPITTTAGYSLNIKTLTGGKVTTTTTTTTGGMVGTGRIVFTDAGNNVDFAGISASGSPRTNQAATYTSGLPGSGASSTVTYSHTNNASVTASESVYALKLTTSTTGQALTIDAGQTLTLTSGGLLFTGADAYSITGGTLTSATATASDLIIHQYGAGALTISSVIANGIGASTLTKAGTGTLVLSGANTFTGSPYVTGGILSISSDNNIGGYNGTFANLTSLTNSASVTYTGSLPAGFDVGSTMLGRTVNAINTGTSTITLSGNANTTLTGGTASWVSATPTLCLYSGGILQATENITLQESNAGGSAGTTTVNRGVTIGNSGGGFDVTTGKTLTITGGIGAPGMMTKSGAGTLTLSAANNLTGGITINDGILKLNIANALTANSGYATSSLILGSGTAPTLQLNGFNASLLSLVSTNANAIVENSNTTTSVGITICNGADNTFAGIIRDGAGTKTLSLSKAGAGTLTLSGANTYTGGTTVYGGKLRLGDGTIGNDGSITGNITITNNADLVYNLFGSRTNSAVISGNGSLTKVGSGTLTLSGASTYTGATTINDGVLQIGNGGAAGSLSTSSVITNNATLVFKRSNTITQGTDFYTGAISGSGPLIQAGTGTLILNTNNSYTGGTTISNGVLKLACDNAVSSNGTVTVVSGAILDLANYNQTLSNLAGSGIITNLASGKTLTITGTNTFSGTIAGNGAFNVTGVISPGGRAQSVRRRWPML